MTINNQEAFTNSLWDWACLDGCFGETRIKPSDVDGEIERNFKFLRIETKGTNTALKQGQEILLRHYVDNPQCTVLVVWGDPGKPTRIRILTKYTDKTLPCDLQRLRTIVATWFRHANDPDRWIDHSIKQSSQVLRERIAQGYKTQAPPG